MTREHTELLAELEKLCFARPWSQKALLDEVDNPNAYFVTAVDGDIVLGYGGMHCARKEYYMGNVAGFAPHKRKGVGGASLGGPAGAGGATGRPRTHPGGGRGPRPAP